MGHITHTSVSQHFVNCLKTTPAGSEPYRHWLLNDMYPHELAVALEKLPFAASEDLDFGGRRECNNSTRMFADPQRQAEFPELDALAHGMAAPETVAAIEETCGISLAGTYLRIEYCRDTEGFWLEPHTDIGAKRFTMLCYLSAGEGSDPCGTDILADADTFVTTAPFHLNSGVIFIPGDNTWHSFRPRRINGIRKSVMVNFVGEEWRARHELAFDKPVK